MIRKLLIQSLMQEHLLFYHRRCLDVIEEFGSVLRVERHLYDWYDCLLKFWVHRRKMFTRYADRHLFGDYKMCESEDYYYFYHFY